MMVVELLVANICAKLIGFVRNQTEISDTADALSPPRI